MISYSFDFKRLARESNHTSYPFGFEKNCQNYSATAMDNLLHQANKFNLHNVDYSKGLTFHVEYECKDDEDN